MNSLAKINAAKAAFARATNHQLQACANASLSTQLSDSLCLDHLDLLMQAGSVEQWLPCRARTELEDHLQKYNITAALKLIDLRATNPLPAEGQAFRHTLIQLQMRLEQHTQMTPRVSDVPQTVAECEEMKLEASDQAARRVLTLLASAFEARNVSSDLTSDTHLHPCDIVPLDASWWQLQWQTQQFERSRKKTWGSSQLIAQQSQIIRHLHEQRYRTAMQLTLPLVQKAVTPAESLQAHLLATRAAWLAGQHARAMTMLYALPHKHRNTCWHRWALTVAIHHQDLQALDECIEYLIQQNHADPITRLHAAKSALRHGNTAAAEIHLRIVVSDHDAVLGRLAQHRLIQLFLAQERFDEARYCTERLLAAHPADQVGQSFLERITEHVFPSQRIERQASNKSKSSPQKPSMATIINQATVAEKKHRRAQA
jgi:hypothetical protein